MVMSAGGALDDGGIVGVTVGSSRAGRDSSSGVEVGRTVGARLAGVSSSSSSSSTFFGFAVGVGELSFFFLERGVASSPAVVSAFFFFAFLLETFGLPLGLGDSLGVGDVIVCISSRA